MDILSASALAILPCIFSGALAIRGCAIIKPCLGGFAPVLMCLKRAFSALSTWIVEEGISLNLFRLPACSISFAQTRTSHTAFRLGHKPSINAEIYSNWAFLSWYRLHIWRAKLLMGSMS